MKKNEKTKKQKNSVLIKNKNEITFFENHNVQTVK